MWTKFWLETNVVWGWISSREEWLTLLKNQSYMTTEEAFNNFLLCKAHHNREVPYNFGFFAEHTGEQTLKDFLEESGNDYKISFEELYQASEVINCLAMVN